MVILIGNQKGGAGKSTLTLLLANYLVEHRSRDVTVLDMDYQQSLYSKSQKARILENKPLYEVIPAELKDFPVMQKAMQSRKGELLLIDLPGKMDDDGLLPLFASADVILCPFSYDELSVDSTVLFAMVIRKLNSKCPLVFVPNRIKHSVKYETQAEVENVLRKFGAIMPPLSDRVDFQRISTFQTPLILLPVIVPVLDLLYTQYLEWKEVT